MSNWASTMYKTTDWSAYNKTLKRRGPRSIRFEPDTTWGPCRPAANARCSAYSATL